MSVNSVSSVSTSQVASSSSSSSQISSSTKKKLEELAAQGVNVSNIKTEAQAEALINKVESAQQQQKAQGANAQQGNNSEATIKTEITDLAQKMGVAVGNDDKVSDIMDKVSQKLTELQSSAGSDASKKSEYEQYASQYSDIEKEYNQSQSGQSMISGSMNGMANYNKALLGL
ncbi:hypothetical protein KBA27_03290 [bacterium]|nr:hypothetical protein [bacterium]